MLENDFKRNFGSSLVRFGAKNLYLVEKIGNLRYMIDVLEENFLDLLRIFYAV